MLYWYKTCPFCGQGRLFIYKDINADRLYLHCEECERGYYDPSNIVAEASFLILSENFEAKEASVEDIVEGGWGELRIEASSE